MIPVQVSIATNGERQYDPEAEQERNKEKAERDKPKRTTDSNETKPKENDDAG